MGIRAAFELQLFKSDPRDGFDDLIWQSLSAAAESSKHPWNLGAISTVDCRDEGAPKPASRMVVLRSADRNQRFLDFHTDARSSKLDELNSHRAAKPIAWLFWESSTKIQLRLQGTATIIDGDLADRAWQQTSLHSRSAYLSLAPPGVATDDAQPPDTGDRHVSMEESERARENFRVIRTTIASADWLYLRRESHVRAMIDYRSGGGANFQWLVP